MRFVVTANLLGFPAISVPVSINTIYFFLSLVPVNSYMLIIPIFRLDMISKVSQLAYKS